MGLGGGVPARLWAFWVWTGKQWGLGGGGGVLGRGKDSLRAALQGKGCLQGPMTELGKKVWPGGGQADGELLSTPEEAKGMGTLQAQRREVWSTRTLTPAPDPTQQVQTSLVLSVCHTWP